MKSVLLDKFFLVHLELSPLFKALPGLITFDTTTPDQIVDRCKDADIILTNKCILDKAILKELKNLKFIQIMATGMDSVDVEYAKSRGIIVKNIEGYSSQSVATYILTSILNLFTSIPTYVDEVKKGKWEKSKGFTFLDYPIETIKEKKLGIIGYGHIGKEVETMVKPLGMKTLIAQGNKPHYTEDRLPLHDVLKQADIVLLICPLTEQTRHMISIKELKIMKPTAFLINAARGPLINEKDLAEALNNNIIAGAACDVLSKEPPTIDNPLLNCSHKKLYITPHIAWAAISSRQDLLNKITSNCNEFLENIKG